MGAHPIGAPGCPEFDDWTQSADTARIVLIHSNSRGVPLYEAAADMMLMLLIDVDVDVDGVIDENNDLRMLLLYTGKAKILFMVTMMMMIC